MGLILEIIDGDQKGRRIPVTNGLILGRKETDVILKDSKVSARHASIEIRDHTAFLVDLGSSNLIKVTGARVRELELKDGVEFTLGRTLFRTHATNKEEEKTIEKEDDGTAVIHVFGPPPDEIVIETPPETWPKTWQEAIGPLLNRAQQHSRPVQRDFAPFSQVIRLKFLRGVQTGTEWTLGYGPREVGASSVDLPLEEIGLPEVCFRLLPHHNGILLKTDASAGVKINGKPADSEFLNDGDVIDVKNTRIQIAFNTGE